ncbi:protein FRA10AC1-like [Paramacrobiotus metropolitanus]|uniref:protein FRA10AC1-like n=1 Tax=Paramacrobiotus metropolitanus TaxID=2943436 RepID=UPI0024458E46|nr:protein FRA10AC1-like [Paramacrobiotus metropolitanus]
MDASGSRDYSSEFEYDSEADKKRKRRHDLTNKELPAPVENVGSKRYKPPTKSDALYKDSRDIVRYHASGMDAYSRHKKMINDYLLITPGDTKLLRRDTSRDRTDKDVIRENHKFLWDEENEDELSWEQKLAKKYYDKLFKEYCIADLHHYKHNKIGMRWRTEKEVIEGKGQFICGSKHCSNQMGLRSWEVNFGYMENETKKNALIKLRLCPSCSGKLNHNKAHKDVSREAAPVVIKEEPLSPSHVPTQSSSTESSLAVPTEEQIKEQEKAIWGQPAPAVQDKPVGMDFDQYFADMLF